MLEESQVEDGRCWFSARGGGGKGCCTYITYYFFKGPPGIQGLPGAPGKLGNPVSIQSGRSGSKQSRFMEDFSTVLHLKMICELWECLRSRQ